MMNRIAQLAADYQAGATLRQLGQRYGYSHTQIAAHLAAQGVERRHKWHYSRTCPICGKIFNAEIDQRCCSRSCGQQLRRQQEVR